MVIPVRFERTTLSLEGRCSIQLSYGTTLRTNIAEGAQTSKLIPKIQAPDRTFYMMTQ